MPSISVKLRDALGGNWEKVGNLPGVLVVLSIQKQRVFILERLGWVRRLTVGFVGALAFFYYPTLQNHSSWSTIARAQQTMAHHGSTVSQLRWGKSQSKQSSMSLTSSDGAGLKLLRVQARTVVEGPLAFTELQLRFFNPQARRLEGRFRIALPVGASVSRLAMKVGARWLEGEVLEKQRARSIYEQFLHKRRDPALLEQGAGNQYSVRVFPIAARATKEIIISYSQEVKGEKIPLVPLAGLSSLEILDVQVSDVSSGRHLSLVQRNTVPAGDLYYYLGSDSAESLRSDDVLVVKVRGPELRKKDPLLSVLIAVDTSASQGASLELQAAFVQQLCRDIAEQSWGVGRVAVVAFDQGAQTIFEGKADQIGSALTKRILERGALGATDFSGALKFVTKLVRRGKYGRIIFLSNGVSTAGNTSRARLENSLRLLKIAGAKRLDVVSYGRIVDEAWLRTLVSYALPNTGAILSGSSSVSDTIYRLHQRVHAELKVSVPGALWHYPTTLSGLLPGEEVLVYAKLPKEIPLKVKLEGFATRAYKTRTARGPLVQRAWARAKISQLLSLDRHDPATRQEVIHLSTRYRVLSPYTSLLVLETEKDYQRAHIQRKALREIITVRNGELELLHRSHLPPVQASTSSKNILAARGQMNRRALSPFAESSQWGSSPRQNKPISSSGITKSALTSRGRGFGSKKKGGSHQTYVPIIRPKALHVEGSIDSTIVRRVIRQNHGQHRLCYEVALRKNVDLRGMITIKFVIDRKGYVSQVLSLTSTFADSELGKCISTAIARLRFPPTQGEVTRVEQSVSFQGYRRRRRFSTPSARDTLQSAPVAARFTHRTITVDPHLGELNEVMKDIKEGRTKKALLRSRRWLKSEPSHVLALVALGRSLKADKQTKQAARAYGSLIDLYSDRADLRRFAGEQLESLNIESALELARDTYAKSQVDRPDHLSTYRLHAFALVKQEKAQEAFAVLEDALMAKSRNRLGVHRIIQEDLGLIAAAWKKAEPGASSIIDARLKRAGGRVENEPSLRFVLNWETDANDVDLHVVDDQGAHAFFERRALKSGGYLYSDVTDGYGPECFTTRIVRENRPKKYKIMAHYYSRGPLGFGMGKLQVIDHDGRGGLKFQERPFVVMKDKAFVDLGEYRTSF